MAATIPSRAHLAAPTARPTDDPARAERRRPRPRGPPVSIAAADRRRAGGNDSARAVGRARRAGPLLRCRVACGVNAVGGGRGGRAAAVGHEGGWVGRAGQVAVDRDRRARARLSLRRAARARRAAACVGRAGEIGVARFARIAASDVPALPDAGAGIETRRRSRDTRLARFAPVGDVRRLARRVSRRSGSADARDVAPAEWRDLARRLRCARAGLGDALVHFDGLGPGAGGAAPVWRARRGRSSGRQRVAATQIHARRVVEEAHDRRADRPSGRSSHTRTRSWPAARRVGSCRRTHRWRIQADSPARRGRRTHRRRRLPRRARPGRTNLPAPRSHRCSRRCTWDLRSRSRRCSRRRSRWCSSPGPDKTGRLRPQRRCRTRRRRRSVHRSGRGRSPSLHRSAVGTPWRQGRARRRRRRRSRRGRATAGPRPSERPEEGQGPPAGRGHEGRCEPRRAAPVRRPEDQGRGAGEDERAGCSGGAPHPRARRGAGCRRRRSAGCTPPSPRACRHRTGSRSGWTPHRSMRSSIGRENRPPQPRSPPRRREARARSRGGLGTTCHATSLRCVRFGGLVRSPRLRRPVAFVTFVAFAAWASSAPLFTVATLAALAPPDDAAVDAACKTTTTRRFFSAVRAMMRASTGRRPACSKRSRWAPGSIGIGLPSTCSGSGPPSIVMWTSVRSSPASSLAPSTSVGVAASRSRSHPEHAWAIIRGQTARAQLTNDSRAAWFCPWSRAVCPASAAAAHACFASASAGLVARRSPRATRGARRARGRRRAASASGGKGVEGEGAVRARD